VGIRQYNFLVKFRKAVTFCDHCVNFELKVTVMCDFMMKFSKMLNKMTLSFFKLLITIIFSIFNFEPKQL